MNYKLSKPQEAIYYMSRFSEDSIANIAGDVFFNFVVTVDAAKEAILNFLDKCDIMHTRIIHIDGKPFQRIIRDYEYNDIPILNFENYKKYCEWAREEAKIPINIDDCLYRIFLIDISGKIGLFAVTHHIISDATSFAYIGKYVTRYLKGERDVVIYPYYEYIQSEKEYETSKRYNKDKLFWLEEYKKIEANYYCDKVIDSKQSTRCSFIINKEICDRIKLFCNTRDITEYALLFSVLAIKYFKTTQKEEFFIATPILNRYGNREENMLGVFVNTVPVGFKVQCEDTFNSFCDKTMDKILTCFRHQKYHYTQLLKDTVCSIDDNVKMFDVMFSFWNVKTHDESKAEWFSCCSQIESLQIHIDDRKSEEKYLINYDYQTEKFTEKDIIIFHNHFCNLILDALENPDKKICELSMLSAEEKQMIVYDFNNTAHCYDIPEDSTLYSLFERTASENEDKICIRTSDKNMTFGELLEKSGKLDAEIRRITGDKKSVVAVIAERSPEMYSAIYGIIRGGNAYLPIDPDYPQERIEYILENSEAKAVVVQGKFINKVKNTPVINMTELLNSAEKTKAPLCAAKPEDTAYVIYTSGSTGNPKGAKVSHRSAVNRILWMHDKYPLGKDDVILQKTPYTFDVSVWEHFWWGMCGGSLAVSKPGEHFLPAKILDETSQSKVTHIHFVPSVFELFLNYLESHREEISKFNSVRYVFLSGEALTADLVQRFYKLYDFGKVTLHNLYGPTECAVDVTYYDCVLSDTDPVPIGKPVYNTQIHILDKYLKPVPIGVVGELCIAGENVGQGYLNNPELTSEKFIDNPFGEGKMYRTGDNAYFREDGNIIFVGRKDNQIKLNGQRIEVGEIEAVISCVPEVKSVAVVARKIENRYVLVAFYTGEDNAEALIKDSCVEKLPKYMVPSYVVQIDELPLNQSGKLNRKALLEMPFTATEFEVLAPVNETEKYICSVFSEYFTEESIGRNSDFFDLGGTSLTMISVLSEDGFENVTAAEFMRNPTPEALARLIDKNPAKEAQYLEPLFVPGHYKQVMILLPFAGGGAEAYSNFVACLKKLRQDTAIYFIRYLHSAEECECAVTEIAEFFCDKDILFYSHCVGSAVAIQIISNLEKQNISVKHYFAAASIPPEKPSGKNIWRGVPDKVLNFILSKAGARINSLSSKERKDMIIRFRKDTDFANISFANFKSKIKVSVSVILTRRDIFTYNYRHACKLWKNYAEEVENIYYINSKTHYFQSENSEELVEYMLSYIK